jgi:hypothetical protein
MNPRYAVMQRIPTGWDCRLRGHALHSIPYLALRIPIRSSCASANFPPATGGAGAGGIRSCHDLSARWRRSRPGPI